MAMRLALLSGHYRRGPGVVGRRCWTGRCERLTTWRAAAGREGADADSGSAGVLHDLRSALTDDLDTPTAIAVLDRWAADDSLDGAVVADAVDALLGITLR